jgi:hypothetical protein
MEKLVQNPQVNGMINKIKKKIKKKIHGYNVKAMNVFLCV